MSLCVRCGVPTKVATSWLCKACYCSDEREMSLGDFRRCYQVLQEAKEDVVTMRRISRNGVGLLWMVALDLIGLS